MMNSNANSQKRHGVRPTYITLGTDTEGASHVYRTTDETVHVVEDGRRVEQFDLDGRSVDTYVKFVRDDVEDREWANRRYIADDENALTALAGELVDAIEAGA